MKLMKIRLGDIVLPLKEKCGIPNLSPYQVSGINKDKEFFEPSRQVGEETSNYLNVPPKFFACNLMHVGRDVVLPIAYNHTETTKCVSPAYTVFRLKENCGLLDYYFFVFLKSHERDRFFWFFTDGSIRDGMTWDDFCNVEIVVPNRKIQEAYVNVYLSLLENQRLYERGLNDLKLVCDGFINDLLENTSKTKIGPYLRLSQETNADYLLDLDSVRGISIQKKFIDTKANMSGVSLEPYLLVRPKSFAYVPVTSRNGDKITLGYNDGNEVYLVSSSYLVFSVVDPNSLDPDYLFMLFNRPEFDRYARFCSWGSAREVFSWEEMCNVRIPLPNIDVQRSIAKVFKTYNERKRINEQLKRQLLTICPILIKGSIEEAERS